MLAKMKTKPFRIKSLPKYFWLAFLLVCTACVHQNNTPPIAKKWNDIVAYEFKGYEVSSEIPEFDLSSILCSNPEDQNFFTSYVGALGSEFQRLDLSIDTAREIGNQDYKLESRLKIDDKIIPLSGQLNFKDYYFLDSNTPIGVITFNFLFQSSLNDSNITIRGICSVSFMIKDENPINFWFADGTFQEYVRTFVGVYTANESRGKEQIVFGLVATGLELHLPFCDELFYPNEEGTIYYINDKYKTNGWSEYDEVNNSKYNWK